MLMPGSPLTSASRVAVDGQKHAILARHHRRLRAGVVHQRHFAEHAADADLSMMRRPTATPTVPSSTTYMLVPAPFPLMILRRWQSAPRQISPRDRPEHRRWPDRNTGSLRMLLCDSVCRQRRQRAVSRRSRSNIALISISKFRLQRQANFGFRAIERIDHARSHCLCRGASRHFDVDVGNLADHRHFSKDVARMGAVEEALLDLERDLPLVSKYMRWMFCGGTDRDPAW